MPELVFEWLAQSRWSLDRQFDNPKMPGLSASGEARFLLLATNQLSYLEEGELSAGGSFSKRYTFTWVPDGIEVVHDDPHNRGQAFQTLVLAPNDQGAWMCRASNFCAPTIIKACGVSPKIIGGCITMCQGRANSMASRRC